MIPTSIILAGGFGTRLQSVVKDIPKPMAEVNGKPFLEYLLQYVHTQGIQKSILSVGHKHETIRKYFGNKFRTMEILYFIEDEPLGTGGAIRYAIQEEILEEFLIMNGDTLFKIDLNKFYQLHTESKSLLSVALKPMKKFDRYGNVATDSNHHIVSFQEKGFYEEGNINGGIYLLNRKLFDRMKLSQKFSFERDVLEKYCGQIEMFGFPFDDYFIDIGIPEDYERAQQEFKRFED